MPLVRIDISKTASRERVRDVGNAVYNAMIAVANVPENDRFQVITRHDPNESILSGTGSSRHRLSISSSPTKFTPSRVCASRTSGSTWSIPAARGLVFRQWRDVVGA